MLISILATGDSSRPLMKHLNGGDGGGRVKCKSYTFTILFFVHPYLIKKLTATLDIYGEICATLELSQIFARVCTQIFTIISEGSLLLGRVNIYEFLILLI